MIIGMIFLEFILIMPIANKISKENNRGIDFYLNIILVTE